jgi:hypothetical protein
MQYVADGLLVADIPSAYAPHLLGVCLVQFAEGIRIPLPAPFYQPCHFHRKRGVSIYKVLRRGKDCTISAFLAYFYILYKEKGLPAFVLPTFLRIFAAAIQNMRQ